MFSDPTIPVGNRIFRHSTQEFDQRLKYDYDTIEKLMEDERVSSVVALVASLARNAYKGPEILPKFRYSDTVLDDKESQALEEADKIARKLKFKQLTFDWAWELGSHGDLFEQIIKDEDGVVALKSLPLNATRVLANREQVVKLPANMQIIEEGIIAVKRNLNDVRPTIYGKGQYLHLSYKNRGVWRKDIDGIETYSIYSKPPIASLQRLAKWKEKTIENDILWKNKLLPRIEHILKMPGIVPSKYMGTQEEKIAAAKKDADKLANDFINNTKVMRPDDDLVHSDAVETKILEAKSTNYQKPNETISQINTFLNTTHAIPSGLLGGEAGPSVGIEISGIYASIRVDYIVSVIADGFTEILKSHLRRKVSNVGEDVIDRIYIHTDPSLSREKFERIKIAISMAATKQFTKREIRDVTGYAPIPQLPKEAMADIDVSNAKTTLRELESDNEKTVPSNGEMHNRTPQGKRNTMEEQRV